MHMFGTHERIFLIFFYREGNSAKFRKDSKCLSWVTARENHARKLTEGVGNDYIPLAFKVDG